MTPLRTNPSESVSATINIIVNHEDKEYERVVPKCEDEDEDQTPNPRFSLDEETQVERDWRLDYYGPGY